MELLYRFVVRMVWRPIAWDVPLTKGWDQRLVASWSDQAKRWVK